MKFLISLFGLLIFSSCSNNQEYEEKERVLGYQGKARKNPYLAAERFLEEDGVDVKSMQGVVKMDDSESLVFAPASTVRSAGDGERILQWIANGGHFVCFLERGEDFWRDVGDDADHFSRRWSDDFDDAQGLKIILERVGLELVENDYDEEALLAEGKKILLNGFEEADEAVAKGESLPTVELIKVDYMGKEVELLLGGTKGVKRTVNYGDWNEGDDGVKRFESLVYGAGRVTILSDARLFRNPYLKMADHAEMLDALVASSEEGKVVFSLGKVRTFTSMLTEYAWMAVIGFIVLTAMWLWKNLPKYGPTLDVVDGHYRSSSQQVLAVGNFLWMHKRDDALLHPLRHEILRQSGSLNYDGSLEEGLIERLAEVSELSVEDVNDAMTCEQVREANKMVQITKNLQQILKSL